MRRLLAAIAVVALLAAPAYADKTRRIIALKSLSASVTLVAKSSDPKDPDLFNAYCGGTFIQADIVITASHCVRGKSAVMVRFYSEEVVPAKVLYFIPTRDLALLRTEKAGISFVSLSTDLQVGDEIMLIGAPVGVDFVLEVGYVALIGDWEFDNKGDTGKINVKKQQMFLHTAMSIGGFSGGGIFDSDGMLVGVHIGHLTVTEKDKDNKTVLVDRLWGIAVGPAAIKLALDEFLP